MPAVAQGQDAPTAIQSNLAAIFISLELSRSIWLVASSSPGSAQKMSKHSVRAGDVAALLARFWELKRKASERTGKCTSDRCHSRSGSRRLLASSRAAKRRN